MNLANKNRKNKIYGNCQVYSPKGNLMFLCVEKKANWYLDRGLAEVISQDPLSIKLLFEPESEGNHGDDYYLTEKHNKCVKCATEDLEVLTRHHIVPHQYRKFMPEDIKSNSSFDVVPICYAHHNYYERFADELKQELADKYNAPLAGVVEVDEILISAISAAKAIVGNGDKLPEDRRKILEEKVLLYFETFTYKNFITNDDLVELSKMKSIQAKKITTHSEIVMKQIEDFQGFVEMWREHFLKHLDPEHMPKHWDPKRSVYRRK